MQKVSLTEGLRESQARSSRESDAQDGVESLHTVDDDQETVTTKQPIQVESAVNGKRCSITIA